ncbi:MAG: UDP-N-acetylmuramoyl-L-alanine--D-glutamate ligase [Myxococcaceae bacterium]
MAATFAPLSPAPDLALKGRRVVVLGLAKSGLAAIALLQSRGAQVIAMDAKSETELGPVVAQLKQQGVTLALGDEVDNALAGVGLVVVSPGVPLTVPALKTARANGAQVMGEVELAWLCLSNRERCVGITGTNGKSTTTALTGELFQKGGGKIFVGGNLGRPLSEAALGGGYDTHVVELSSFQLEGMEHARFRGAAILNLTPDHLDRYASHEAYGAAKARIFAAQGAGDFAVVNADDAQVMRLSRQARVPVYTFTLSGSAPRPSQLAGCAAPTEDGFAFDFGSQDRFVLRNRALRGAHNVQNAMAAALLARLSSVSRDAVQAGLDSYPGLPHRMESVRVLEGVEWINDSKATNVDSTLVALQAFPQNVWLIAGGKGKGAPYTPMVNAARGKVKGVLTVGADAAIIGKACHGTLPVHPCETIAGAVAKARGLAVSGDVVLLSPACASYDQFKNFEERGDTFKRLVRELA